VYHSLCGKITEWLAISSAIPCGWIVYCFSFDEVTHTVIDIPVYVSEISSGLLPRNTQPGTLHIHGMHALHSNDIILILHPQWSFCVVQIQLNIHVYLVY